MNTSDFPREIAQGPITWNDIFLLGYPPLDDVHEEFIDTLHAMQIASDDKLPACLETLAIHAQGHFDQEDRWMQETGFPPRDCHIQEHAAVIASITLVRQRVGQGDLAEARRLAEALAEWFPSHADHLDSALSHWMCKLRWGGKPVVLRRRPIGPWQALNPTRLESP